MTKATLIKTQGMNSKQEHDFDTKCDPVKNEATATGIDGWGNSRTDAGDPYVKTSGGDVLTDQGGSNLPQRGGGITGIVHRHRPFLSLEGLSGIGEQFPPFGFCLDF